MRRATRIRAAIATLVAVLVTAPLGPTAAATDHVPPRTRLVVQGRGQTGELGTFCWTRRDGSGVLCGDQFHWHFPRHGLVAEPTRKARIRVKNPARIQIADLHGWRRIERTDDGTAPVGRGRDFDVRIRPLREEGEVTGWVLVFRLPRREGHLYLDLFVRWRTRGTASYTFHLRLEK